MADHTEHAETGSPLLNRIAERVGEAMGAVAARAESLKDQGADMLAELQQGYTSARTGADEAVQIAARPRIAKAKTQARAMKKKTKAAVKKVAAAVRKTAKRAAPKTKQAAARARKAAARGRKVVKAAARKTKTAAKRIARKATRRR